jgi:hypothetical protein
VDGWSAGVHAHSITDAIGKNEIFQARNEIFRGKCCFFSLEVATPAQHPRGVRVRQARTPCTQGHGQPHKNPIENKRHGEMYFCMVKNNRDASQQNFPI